MGLDVVQCILHHVMFGNQIFQLATVGVLLNALRNDTEAVQMHLFILRVLKVISNTTTHTAINTPHDKHLTL